MRQVAAVDARMELDLRIGAAFTRFQTMGLRPLFEAIPDNAILSFGKFGKNHLSKTTSNTQYQGSCQFPTLGFIVDQFEKVKAFVPEPFWKIEVTTAKEGNTTKFNWGRNHSFDHQICVAIYERCVLNPLARVTLVSSKPTEKW
jgi:DNA topoisomerase-3